MRLHTLSRSLPLTAVALAAITNACSLPQVQPRMTPDFASGATRVKSIAVLPVDLSVEVAGQAPGSAETVQLDRKMLDRIHRGLAVSLARRGYQVTGVVEPDGSLVDPRDGNVRLVIHPQDLSALRVEIHQATSIFAPGPGFIEASVSTTLTRQLRLATGADASLYARGWAYVGNEESDGAKAAKIVLAVLFIVIIVAVLFAVIAGSKGKGGGHGGGTARAAGHGLAGAARAAATVGHVMIRTMPYVAHGAIHAQERADAMACYTCPPPPPLDPPSPESSPYDDDPAIPAPPPPPVAQAAPIPGPPPEQMVLRRTSVPPSRSEVGLAVSLVQNASGRVLWHADQSFSVKTEGQADVETLIEHFLSGLPQAR
jgi:hypothetical protein